MTFRINSTNNTFTNAFSFQSDKMLEILADPIVSDNALLGLIVSASALRINSVVFFTFKLTTIATVVTIRADELLKRLGIVTDKVELHGTNIIDGVVPTTVGTIGVSNVFVITGSAISSGVTSGSLQPLL